MFIYLLFQLTDFGLSEEAVHLSDSESETPNEGFFGDLDDLDDDDLSSDGALLKNKRPGDQLLSASLLSSPEQFGLDESISAFFDASRPPRRRNSKQKQKRKQAHPHTYGRCGTPDYLSPEIILGVPHGPPVDYWALGIILYEMLVGFPPFNDDTVEAIFSNILERQILWPDGEKCLSLDAIDLISKLLEPDQAIRLDWEGLTQHQFFEGIDWDTLLDSIPPFVPTLEGPNDTSYFNNRNLTDTFIDDDDEFEFDAKSVDSSVLDQQEAGGGSRIGGGIGGDEQDKDLGNLSGDLDGEAEVVSDASNSDTGSDTVSVSGGVAGLGLRSERDQLGDGDGGGGGGDDYAENNNFRFPSGMYETTDDANLTEAFRSFSYTNMNALAAASRTEAELITDSRLNEVENSSALSILI